MPVLFKAQEIDLSKKLITDIPIENKNRIYNCIRITPQEGTLKPLDYEYLDISFFPSESDYNIEVNDEFVIHLLVSTTITKPDLINDNKESKIFFGNVLLNSESIYDIPIKNESNEPKKINMKCLNPVGPFDLVCEVSSMDKIEISIKFSPDHEINGRCWQNSFYLSGFDHNSDLYIEDPVIPPLEVYANHNNPMSLTQNMKDNVIEEEPKKKFSIKPYNNTFFVNNYGSVTVIPLDEVNNDSKRRFIIEPSSGSSENVGVKKISVKILDPVLNFWSNYFKEGIDLSNHINKNILKNPDFKFLTDDYQNLINNNKSKKVSSKPHSSAKGNQNTSTSVITLKTFNPETIETCYKVVLKGGIIWDIGSTFNCREPEKNP
ncbi:hypothetical protein BCR36DRAFT_588500 [Piromyces finnis]|uniref:Uncharacterized protein n=1 Tax=Piromyces finnis TaxID=1754191 RepID=A0A1Y1UDT9_9FUNG|nr:hypothetical protein BCR36DRAFT_588500 [Piromyces finnis]|eukprot:ORX36182.1 hypothetical protein BCR36DRAFT_588500 [Piromyces finnis]